MQNPAVVRRPNGPGDPAATASSTTPSAGRAPPPPPPRPPPPGLTAWSPAHHHIESIPETSPFADGERDSYGVANTTRRTQRESSASRDTVSSKIPGQNISREGELIRFSSRELSMHANRRQIFAFIVLADRLERAWLKGAISSEVYESQCYDLLRKFTAAKKAFVSEVPDIERFAVEFKLDAEHGYPLGYHRLVVSGVPATKAVPVPAPEDQKSRMKISSRITAGCITLLDAIEMGHNTPESLLPLTQELNLNLGSMEGLGNNFAFSGQIEQWSQKLHRMNALATLSSEELKTFKLQVDMGYMAFQNHLDN